LIVHKLKEIKDVMEV